MKRIALASLLLIATFNFAVGQHSTKGAKGAKGVKEIKFETDPATGIKYHFFKHNKTGAKAVLGDYATIILIYKNDKDSLVFDSRNLRTRKKDDSLGVVTIPLQKTFNGCLEQGITLMAEGDSAEFKLNTDSVFLKTFKAPHLPPFVHAGTYLSFDVKLVKFRTEEQLKEEQKQQLAYMQKHETEQITKYLTDNKLNITPTSDGMYILQDTPGTGKAVANGDSVEVKYKGMFLDGKIFDQSSAHGGKGTFTFQYGPNVPLIKGWVILIGSMKEGQKTTVLIPSNLGYGDRGAGGLIPPYTPLIFEIEVVRATPQKG